MEELDDLGALFAEERRFCFDDIIVHEIIFDESNDVTLFCTVPYYGKMYSANFGLTFAQLNTLLRSNKREGEPVATAVAEKLDHDIEIPSVVEIESLYGSPLHINNVVLCTTLFDLENGPDEDLEEEDMEEEEEEEGYDAYAFLVDEIVMKRPEGNEN